jgi:hypothetical protein
MSVDGPHMCRNEKRYIHKEEGNDQQLSKNTQYVSLRQNVEEKERGKGLNDDFISVEQKRRGSGVKVSHFQL